MGSVDDPEKHFLGNLLEDDPLSSLGPSSQRSTTSTTETPSSASIPIPTTSIFRPISSSYWPEPPPPYTPRIPAESWLSSGVGGLGGQGQNQGQSQQQTPLLSGDWFSSMDRKDTTTSLNNNASTRTTSDLFGFTPLNLNTNTTTTTNQPSSSEVHHFHHNLHHHTHTHNVVQNHYFTTTTRASPLSPLASPDTLSGHPSFGDDLGGLDEAARSDDAAWTYTGIEDVNETPKSLLFSDWKKDLKEKNLAPKGAGGRSKTSYAKASASSSQTRNFGEFNQLKKNSVIGCEKKMKQELAKKLSNHLQQSPPPSGVAQATRIEVKGQPHSAPVVTKMPFSYRDVAARVEPVNSQTHTNSVNSPEDSPPQIVNPRHHQSITEKAAKNQEKSSDFKRRAETYSHIDINSATVDRRLLNKERKSRSDNEFQKINRKVNKKEKTQNAAPVAMPVLENVPRMDAVSRYDVLNNLENAPSPKSNGRAPVIEAIFSRSSSVAEDLESEVEEVALRARSSSTQNSVSSNSMNGGINQNHQQNQNSTRKEQKKRVSVQSGQRRRQRRKNEPRWIDNFMWIVDLLVMIGSYVSTGFQWTFQLIVDFCAEIYNVCLYSIESVCNGCLQFMKKSVIFIFMCVVFLLEVLWRLFKRVTLTRVIEHMLYEDRPEITEWGCRRDVVLPSSASEYIERLIRENNHDAYVVFGLRCDCSDDDIKRNYKRLCALVSPDKCSMDGAEETFDLLHRSFEAIGNPISRLQYSIENAYDNEDHRNVISCWDELRERIEDARCTIYCDCGSRHMRLMTNIRPSEARYCKRCDMNHPAKQNDIWVEKRFLGLKSLYLTCTDNMVYDISQWAMCESQRNMLKNMRAHTHNVQYRLVTPGTNSEQGDYVSNYGNSTSSTSSGINLTQSTHDNRFYNEFSHEDFNLLRQQRSLAQISFKTCEPREEDRSRRAANRRQKRWR